MGRRKKVNESDLSNAELLKKHQAINKRRAPERALCESTRNQAYEGDQKRYLCTRCKTFKLNKDFSPYQLIKPCGMMCLDCQTKPIIYNHEHD
ncbi:hypothetical protein [Vibrio phage vB_VhaS-a]|nr:hypothetical protein [Vibrio phage vB_VhaS-a]